MQYFKSLYEFAPAAVNLSHEGFVHSLQPFGCKLRGLRYIPILSRNWP